MTDADLVLLPWVRRGASAALLADPSNADPPGVATATASVTVNDSPRPASIQVTVLGPGHVTGLDRRQVVRTDPAAGSRSFESNYFPLVELDEPSLPWLFTPTGADAQAHLRPWLVLVVVKLHAGVRVDPPTSGPLPILHVADAQAELPNLDQSWAWAHAQVTSETGVSIDQQLAGNPERTVARLLCSRALEPNTEYLGCLVPAFELGRKAGLGERIEGDDEKHLLPAWTQATTDIALPVYYSWPFATGPGGDFQSLAMLLKARPLPAGVGVQDIDVGASGLESTVPPDTRINLAGALRPAGTPDAAWPTAAVQHDWETALLPVLNAPARVTAEVDPLLAPPLYGGIQAGLVELDASLPSRWFEQLNLLPSHRAIAHLGTRVVQEQQEALMASAWEQAADLERYNQQQRQIQLGWRVSVSLHRRNIHPMVPEVGLQVLAPAISRLVRTSPVLAERLAASGLEPTSSAVALRRVARPRGTLNRRIQRVATATLPRTTSVLTHLRLERLGERLGERLDVRLDERLDERTTTVTPGPVTLERVAADVIAGVTWAAATAAAVAAAPGRPFFAFVPMGQPVPIRGAGPDHLVVDDRVGEVRESIRTTVLRGRGIDDGRVDRTDRDPPVIDDRPPPPTSTDSAAASEFRRLAQTHLKRFLPERPVPSRPLLPELVPLDQVWAEARERIRPTETFAARVRLVFAPPGDPKPDEEVLSELRLSPAFPQPMVAPLAALAQDLIVPGLSLVPPNTIVPLETNPSFVEAYLVGLNTEMAREMLWRGFPAPLGDTYFDRFWDNASAPGRPPDIAPIGEWAGRSLTTGSSAENFVLLIRSELLQRYPDAIVYATRPVVDQPNEDRHPIFTGGFPPDVRYFGFDIPIQDVGGWSIVIQEHPSAPRFGIEVDTDPGGTHVAPGDANAALVAAKARQLPVRITIPTSVLGLA